MKKLLVLLAFMPTLAQAEFFSGNQLLAKMNSTEFGDKMQALGYVQGVFDAHQHVKHCAPDGAGVTAGQVQDIVKDYLNRNPATRNFSADLLITDALKRIWPCATQNKGRGA
jgi:hypothetical protein